MNTMKESSLVGRTRTRRLRIAGRSCGSRARPSGRAAFAPVFVACLITIIITHEVYPAKCSNPNPPAPFDPDAPFGLFGPFALLAPFDLVDPHEAEFFTGESREERRELGRGACERGSVFVVEWSS